MPCPFMTSWDEKIKKKNDDRNFGLHETIKGFWGTKVIVIASVLILGQKCFKTFFVLRQVAIKIISSNFLFFNERKNYFLMPSMLL